jgi:D-alanyl-lipoteichoic acid acyltransferase DltB (MBOAT superfamily)
MTTLFRTIRLICLATWIGGIIFFLFVTNVAFTTLPDIHQAGLIVRGSLIALHHIGLIAGVIYLVFTLALLGTQRDTHPMRAIELVLVMAMLALTSYSQFSVIPRMENDRIALGGDVDKASHDAPQYIHFQRLHGLSVKLEGAVLIEGLILLGLSTIHERENFDRFN